MREGGREGKRKEGENWRYWKEMEASTNEQEMCVRSQTAKKRMSPCLAACLSVCGLGLSVCVAKTAAMRYPEKRERERGGRETIIAQGMRPFCPERGEAIQPAEKNQLFVCASPSYRKYGIKIVVLANSLRTSVSPTKSNSDC